MDTDARIDEPSRMGTRAHATNVSGAKTVGVPADVVEDLLSVLHITTGIYPSEYKDAGTGLLDRLMSRLEHHTLPEQIELLMQVLYNCLQDGGSEADTEPVGDAPTPNSLAPTSQFGPLFFEHNALSLFPWVRNFETEWQIKTEEGLSNTYELHAVGYPKIDYVCSLRYVLNSSQRDVISRIFVSGGVTVVLIDCSRRPFRSTIIPEFNVTYLSSHEDEERGPTVGNIFIPSWGSLTEPSREHKTWASKANDLPAEDILSSDNTITDNEMDELQQLLTTLNENGLQMLKRLERINKSLQSVLGDVRVRDTNKGEG
ncbi:MAG TPA: hypothetical protein VF681_03645 [Abditibacteriaceae bacterium]|jgi:hypothetical protein